jgi:hypothetical protein
MDLRRELSEDDVRRAEEDIDARLTLGLQAESLESFPEFAAFVKALRLFLRGHTSPTDGASLDRFLGALETLNMRELAETGQLPPAVTTPEAMRLFACLLLRGASEFHVLY